MSNPYQTPDADLHEEGVHDPIYIGFWARFVASVVDTLVMGALIVGGYMAFGSLDALLDADAEKGMLGLILQWILPFAFVILFWVYKNATPGKMALDSIIVDAKTGQAPSKGQYVIRYIGYYISSVVLFLGFIWIAFDRRKQGWHDKMAGTVVIKSSHPKE